MRCRLAGSIALMWFALTTAAAHAQSTTGTISGRIVDAQSFTLPGVVVTATGPQGAKSVVTDDQGRFDQTVDVAFTMEIGPLTESVTVVGAAPVLNPTHTAVSSNLESTTLST